MAPPYPLGNLLLTYLPLLYMSTILYSSLILGGGLPRTQCCHGICCWRITVSFSSTIMYVPSFFCVYGISSGIVTFNEIGNPYDVLVPPLDLCGTIIYSFNCSTSIPITKTFFSVNIEALIIFRNGHKNMVFQVTLSPR